MEVVSYLEVLAEKDLPGADGAAGKTMTIHDSCVYARYEDVVDQPRQLLGKIGVTLHEPEMAGKMTHCCGGPIESLMPSKAHEIATKRAEQLAATEPSVAVMCPICMVNLTGAAKGGDAHYVDIANVLADAVLESPSDSTRPAAG